LSRNFIKTGDFVASWSDFATLMVTHAAIAVEDFVLENALETPGNAVTWAAALW
jgi:hypothetical protein